VLRRRLRIHLSSASTRVASSILSVGALKRVASAITIGRGALLGDHYRSGVTIGRGAGALGDRACDHRPGQAGTCVSVRTDAWVLQVPLCRCAGGRRVRIGCNLYFPVGGRPFAKASRVRAPTVREEASCPPPASPIPVVIGDFAPARVARLADEVSYAAGSIVSRIITKWHVPHAVRATARFKMLLSMVRDAR
jgi:hypothetical protein